jgi:hypothetical protein
MNCVQSLIAAELADIQDIARRDGFDSPDSRLALISRKCEYLKDLLRSSGEDRIRTCGGEPAQPARPS